MSKKSHRLFYISYTTHIHIVCDGLNVLLHLEKIHSDVTVIPEKELQKKPAPERLTLRGAGF